MTTYYYNYYCYHHHNKTQQKPSFFFLFFMHCDQNSQLCQRKYDSKSKEAFWLIFKSKLPSQCKKVLKAISSFEE